MKKKLNDNQKKCYTNAMIAFENAYIALCNASGPLPSVADQGNVIRIIQETRDKINELIDKKL